MRIHAGTLSTLLWEVGLLSERPRPGVCAGQKKAVSLALGFLRRAPEHCLGFEDVLSIV